MSLSSLSDEDSAIAWPVLGGYFRGHVFQVAVGFVNKNHSSSWRAQQTPVRGGVFIRTAPTQYIYAPSLWKTPLLPNGILALIGWNGVQGHSRHRPADIGNHLLVVSCQVLLCVPR